MMEGSVFSDAKVIEKLNSTLVSIVLNVTVDGWPKELPGLDPWRKAYDNNVQFHSAYATSVVLLPDGSSNMGTSGSGHLWEWDTSINYHADKYLSFIDGCLGRFARWQKINSDTSLSDEARKAAMQALAAEVHAEMMDSNARGRKRQ